MKQGGQKAKGNSYEIKIARILTKWYCSSFIRKQNDKEDWFWRTAGSGAKSTISRSAQTSFVGDITFLPDPDKLKIWIDTKDVKKATFDTLLSEGRCILLDWYRNEIGKRKRLKVNKPVVIIFKFYRKKENYILFAISDFERFAKRSINTIRLYKHCIMLLEDFLDCVAKEDIIDD